MTDKKPLLRQVMKRGDWVRLVILLIFWIACYSWVWWEYQKPIDINIMINEAASEQVEIVQTKDGQLVKNLAAGYEVTVPKGWFVKNVSSVIEIYNRFNNEASDSEAYYGCQNDINSVNLNGHSLNDWLKSIDQDRTGTEESEPSKTKIVREEDIKIDGKKGIKRIYNPPMGPEYTQTYIINNEDVLVITQLIGVVNQNEKEICERDLNKIINNISFYK
ncbi:MAG: hypothetical protein WC518_02530 [Patescibacteria group bacterium]